MSRVVIVVAGPAGASTVYLLARNGIEVELVERPTGLPQKAWLHAQHDLRYGVANVELNV